MIYGNEESYGEAYYSQIGKKYYTVDLSRRLHSDCIISLASYSPEDEQQDKFLKKIYTDGLSRHGYNYLYNPGPRMHHLSNTSEALMVGLIWELVRRSHFPEKPSRYQCLYACERVDDSMTFRNRQASTEEEINAPIYEVYSKGIVHKGDMNLIDSDCTILELYRRAYIYWSSETCKLEDGYRPFWEILLPLPAYVARKTNF